MYRLAFISLIAFSASTAQAQQVNFEQNAFDYFFHSLFNEKYPNIRSVRFNGQTEKMLTEFDILKNCFESGAEIQKSLYEQAHGRLLPEKGINVNLANGISFKKRSKISLHILQATVVNGKAYVAIELIKHLHFTDAYFFELDQEGNVLRWCKTGLIH